MRHHRQATIIVDFMYKLHHLHMMRSANQGTFQRKLIQCPKETTRPQPRNKITMISSTKISTSAKKHTAPQQARLKRYTSR